MSYFKERFYSVLPITLQNIVFRYYGKQLSKIRFSKDFYRYLDSLKRTEFFRSSEIESYQNLKIKEIIEHVYCNVPYYRDMMKKLKLSPKDITSRDDLFKLPILTKEDVRNNLDKFISEFRYYKIQGISIDYYEHNQYKNQQ